MRDFWTEINRPVFALAPMEDVTDTVFREIVMSISAPGRLNVLFAEFTSTEGLCHEIGRPRVSHRLKVNESEQRLLRELDIRLVAQIWGGDPEKYRRSAKMICEEYDFDGIDINMGCPVRKIVRQAACSELIKFPELAKEIILATKESSTLPVSVKTRTGIKEHITESWIENLLETKPSAITLHGRTQKMMSDFPAVWEEIGKAVELRNRLGSDTLIIGNGDVKSYREGLDKCSTYGVEGIMVGRGIFWDPWFFAADNEPHPSEKIRLLWKHARLFVETWGREKNFAILKRFFKIYTSNFHGAAEIRARLMETNSLDNVLSVLQSSGYTVE